MRTTKTPKAAKKSIPQWVLDAGAALSQYTHLRSDAPTLAPPLPSVDKRLRDLTACGYGTLSRTYFQGLVSQGVSAATAQQMLIEQIKARRLLPRAGGGWVYVPVARPLAWDQALA